MEHSYYQKEHSSKWNTHIIKRNTHQNGTLIKMEYSYYQKEPHQNGTLLFGRASHPPIPCNRLSSSLLGFVPYVLFSGQMDDPSMVSIKINIFLTTSTCLFL